MTREGLELTHARIADEVLKVFADDLVILAHDFADLGGNPCKQFPRGSQHGDEGVETGGTCSL